MQADLFSLGVIIFILVQGIFPFQQASKTNYYYDLFLTDKKTWCKKTDTTARSDEFKDIIFRLLSFDGDDRYTLDQLRAHPWINKPNFDGEKMRAEIKDALAAR